MECLTRVHIATMGIQLHRCKERSIWKEKNLCFSFNFPLSKCHYNFSPISFWTSANLIMLGTKSKLYAEQSFINGVPLHKLLLIFLVLLYHQRHSNWVTIDSLGLLIPAICLVSVGHVDCSSPYVAVAIMMICMGAEAFITPGVHVNDLEIAPPFAGTIHGITNMAGNLSGMAIPSIVAKFTEEVSAINIFILDNLDGRL